METFFLCDVRSAGAVRASVYKFCINKVPEIKSLNHRLESTTTEGRRERARWKTIKRQGNNKINQFNLCFCLGCAVLFVNSFER